MKFPDALRREAWARHILFWGQILLLAGFLGYRAYVGIQTPGTIISHDVIPVPQPEKTDSMINLIRGPLKVLRFVPGDPFFAAHPRAIVVFGSGDGGWGGWEDRVSRALQADGCEMISFDCYMYSRTDYDLPTLQADMNTLAHAYPRPGPMPPVILGGWSMGADQAVAAAGGPRRPADVVGLLLISPSARSRYGEREPDRWNVPPTGPGTFALADFATGLDGLRVAQWDANLDLLDSDAWLTDLSATHKAYNFRLGFHDYAGASDAFLNELKKTVGWILSTQP
ncbi:MAG TPA: AcvB/VirJ family lysyl-phosphatidylglycerol hydrolase [Opitutaceae bacterium]|nr:AcvB/VirJ family lysyl-phosphatidylglycerol hydrolase [Opitutaceae bacterium]